MDLARELRTLIRRPVLGSPHRVRASCTADWHPLVRDPIDLLRLSLVAGALVFLVLGDNGAAVRMATSALAALLVRAIDPPRRFDLAFVVAISLNGWGGAFDLFNQLDWYDNLVHVTLPMAGGAGSSTWQLVRLEEVPAFSSANTARHRVGMAIVACTLGLSAAAHLRDLRVGARVRVRLEQVRVRERHRQRPLRRRGRRARWAATCSPRLARDRHGDAAGGALRRGGAGGGPRRCRARPRSRRRRPRRRSGCR